MMTPAAFAADSSLVCEVHPSPNAGDRRNGMQPSILLLHYTGMASAAKAIDWLSDSESGVSSHYVVDEQGRITQLVPEARRAWHAGVSCWAGETDINSASIGIEIQNPGHADGYHAFPRAQMRAVRDLGLDIQRRRAIKSERVLAHSDVATSRKMDPGERFDWAWLAKAGVGHWVEPSPLEAPWRDVAAAVELHGTAAQAARALLTAYGYVVVDGNAGLKVAVMAFQRHFRPARVDGVLDASTLQTLERLVMALTPAEPTA